MKIVTTLVTTACCLSDFQSKMAALFPRCVSDFSRRIEIYLTRLKQSFCYIWESEAIRLPTLGLDFPGMDFNERPRICLVSTKTCMEIRGSGRRIDLKCCSASNERSWQIYCCSKPIRSLHSLTKL